MLRLNSNGTLDATFGNQGEVLTDVHGSNKYVLVENESGKVTIGGSHWQNISNTNAERKLPDGQNDSGFVFTQTAPGGFGPAGFVRLANRKYLSRFFSPSWQSFAAFNNFVEYGANGEYQSTARYQTEYSGDYADCPRVLAEQQDGRIIMTGNGRLFRFDSNLDTNTAETRSCSNFISLTGKTSGILQADDKMIFAGRYNNRLAIVRLLPN